MGILSRSTILLGLASWAIPFAVSIAFFDRAGQLQIPQPLFKSLMVVIGGGVGCWLLVLAFRRIQPTLASGLTLGLFWLAINLALDLAILVPLAKMTVPGYLQDIGLRYLLLPIIAASMGAAADKSR